MNNHWYLIILVKNIHFKETPIVVSTQGVFRFRI